jgi:hypothetical protein
MEILVMARNFREHMQEDELERYSMRILAEDESAELEEHLLVCEPCRERLEATESFVHGIRAAARKLPEPRPGWFSIPRLAWLAPAAAVLACVVLMVRPGTQPIAPTAVTLQATRGAGPGAQAPAGTPLNLQPDLNGLPPFEKYGLELVDQQGQAVWEGSVKAGGTAIAPGQSAGSWFVRVYSPDRKLLREYGLRIGR